MMSMLRAIVLALLVPLLAAGVSVKASDPQSGARLSVHAPRERIGVAERLALRVETVWAPETGVELVAPEWEDTGWSLIDLVAEPPVVIEDERVRETRIYILEPFLPGAYAVGPFKLEIIGGDGGALVIETDPITLDVLGALAETNGGELNPAAEAIAPDPDDERASDTAALIVVSVAVIFAGSEAVVLLLTRKRAPEPVPSVSEQLTRIARGRPADPQEDYSTLERTFDRLEPRLRQTSEFRQLIATCERARFAPASSETPAPRDIARHALSLLGHDTGEAAA